MYKLLEFYAEKAHLDVYKRQVEVDQGKLYSYPGNYEQFVTLKEERQSMELAAQRKRKSLLRTELELSLIHI